MKKVLLVITLILTLIGCVISKNKLEQLISKDTEEISKIIIDTGRIKNRSPNIISTQEMFDVMISELTETTWIKLLKDSNVDFNKNNVLIYTFKEASICSYKENRVLKDNQQIDITFTYTGGICMDASTVYYLAYKISKDIKKVSIKAFEKEAVIIDI